MEIVIFILGAIFGGLFYSVIKGITRTTKNKQEIEAEIEYYISHNYNEYTKGIINGLKWVLNKK